MADATNVTAVSGQGVATKAGELMNSMTGKPYLWNGKTTDGFDCSGFVTYVFKQLFPNAGSTYDLSVAGFISSDAFTDVDATKAQPGDLVIFPAEGGNVNHIGIVFDAANWIGSQSSTGVAKVKFTNSWWGARSRKFRRSVNVSTASIDLGRGQMLA